MSFGLYLTCKKRGPCVVKNSVLESCFGWALVYLNTDSPLLLPHQMVGKLNTMRELYYDTAGVRGREREREREKELQLLNCTFAYYSFPYFHLTCKLHGNTWL